MTNKLPKTNVQHYGADNIKFVSDGLGHTCIYAYENDLMHFIKILGGSNEDRLEASWNWLHDDYTGNVIASYRDEIYHV